MNIANLSTLSAVPLVPRDDGSAFRATAHPAMPAFSDLPLGERIGEHVRISVHMRNRSGFCEVLEEFGPAPEMMSPLLYPAPRA